MGNSSRKDSKIFQLESPNFYEVEVYIPQNQENTTPYLEINTWIILEFTHKNPFLLVSKKGRQIQSINLNSSFEIPNEQAEELIFTMKFISNDKLQHTWKIRCKNVEEYQVWSTYLKTNSRTHWTHNKQCKVKIIQICTKKFRMLGLRKHHCRKCGESVCKKCSPIRSTLPGLGYTDMVRICLDCGQKVEINRKGLFSKNTPNFNILT